MESAQRRVLVIGLDGATFDLIEPWADQGHLPNLSKLMSDGSRGPLLSTIQPTTAPAWTSFMTGVNQGKHGLYDFVRRKADNYDLEVTDASQIAAPNIFDIASQSGLYVVSVNVPYTFPPRPVNGIIVSGPFAPVVSQDLVSPPTYFQRLQQVVPDYFIIPDYDSRAADPLSDFACKLLEGIEMRERLSLNLMQSEPWDLFTVVFMATDEAQHSFWHCMESPEDAPESRHRNVIRDVYGRIDQAIGRIIDQALNDSLDRETVIVVLSDHGAGPFRWMINLNRWLAETGFLHFRKGGIEPLRQIRRRGFKHLASAYRRNLPAGMRASIRTKLGFRRFQQVKGEFESALLTSAVDWDRTRAYALGAGGNIYINVKGREPAGTVQSGIEYNHLREELSAALMTLSDPETGQPLVERVHRREELYQGKMLGMGPDLIIQWRDYAYWGRGRYDGQDSVYQAQRHLDFSEQPLTGSHRLEGIFIAQGPGIRNGVFVVGAQLLDLAPTILSLLSIAPLPEMDGRVLQEVLDENVALLLPESAVDREITEADGYAYSSDEEKRITDHLRSLGYL